MRQITTGPVEKVQFSLADSFDKPGEFDDRPLSDWCFSTGPYDFWHMTVVSIRPQVAADDVTNVFYLGAEKCGD
jgi:hypothetical protein